MYGPSGSRKCHVVTKKSEEFEFFLSVDEKRKGQIITSVTKDGPAYRAGLRDGDRVIGINGNNVEKKDHAVIVGIIRECIPTNEIDFLVVDADHDPNARKTEAVALSTPKKASAKAHSKPRLCVIKKKNNSFGIFLKAGPESGHFIKSVIKGGAADGTGLRDGDRVIAVNRTNVDKERHAQVVDLIKKSGNKVTLLVIDEDSYQILKKSNTPITEKMAKGRPASSKKSFTDSANRYVKATSASAASKSTQHKGKVRVSHILKHPEKGYGFSLQVKKGIPGEYADKIDKGSAADLSGLQNNDRVMAINGKSIDGVDHADVIGLIKTKKAQVVLVLMDDLARKQFDEKDDYPSPDDVVSLNNHAVRSVNLTKAESGYGMFLKMEKGCRFHIFSDIEKDGVADNAGLKNGEILIAVEGSNVLTVSHEECVKKIKEAGSSVEMFVGSRATGDFLVKFGVAITVDLLKEWPTEEELAVPSFGKTLIPRKEEKLEVEEKIASAVAAVEKDRDENNGLGMKPRLCRVVRKSGGFGFFLKDDNGRHYLTNIERDSPAFQAGILDYDRIVEINGENMDARTHTEVVAKIRGAGEEVTFLVVNREEDEFFKQKGIVITSLLANDELDDNHKPRICTLVRASAGYGFHLKAEPGRKGQFVKEIVNGGAAVVGGLREGDRIIEVNGTNVVEKSHDEIVKKITEDKERVTFLVIDKEGEAYYKLRSITIVAGLAAAKAVVENADADKESIGPSSASSSIMEIEATVHQGATDDKAGVKVGAVAVGAVVHRNEEGAQVDIASVHNEESENYEEVDADEAIPSADDQEIPRDVIKTDAEADEEILNEDEVVDTKVYDDDLEPLTKVEIADQIVENRADRSESEHNRSPTPQSANEDGPSEVGEDVLAKKRDDEEDNLKPAQKVALALVTKEIVDTIGQKDEESDNEESYNEEKLHSENSYEPEPAPTPPAQVEPEVFRPSTPPRSPSPPPEPAVVVAAKSPVPVVQRNISRPSPPNADPLAVALTESGEIARSSSPPPRQTAAPWTRVQLKSINKQISIGAATEALVKVKKADDPAEPTAKTPSTKATSAFSAVAAMKASFERKNRERMQPSGGDNIRNELAELSKQQGGATKHIEKFGGVPKKTQENGSVKKKNPWVGEGMTIKIVET